MKAKDLHERTVEDLKELEKTLNATLFDSRFKNFTNRLDNTASLRNTRREIARVKTVLAQKARGTTPPTQRSAEVAHRGEAADQGDEKPVAKSKKAPAKKAAAPKKAATKKTTEKKA